MGGVRAMSQSRSGVSGVFRTGVGCRVFQSRSRVSGVSEMIFVETAVVAGMGRNESKIYKKKSSFYQYMCLCTGECFEKMHLNNFKLRNISNIKYASRGQKIRWRYTTIQQLNKTFSDFDLLAFQ